MSELTEQINRFELELRQKDGKERSDAYNAVLDLTVLVQELSRKVDLIEEIDEGID